MKQLKLSFAIMVETERAKVDALEEALNTKRRAAVPRAPVER